MKKKTPWIRVTLLDDWGEDTLVRVRGAMERCLELRMIVCTAPISIRIDRLEPGVDSWKLDVVIDDSSSVMKALPLLQAAAHGAVMALEL